jgi:hypothetical protein
MNIPGILFLVIVCNTGITDAGESPRIIQSIEKERVILAGMLDANIRSLTREEQAAHFVTSGRIGTYPEEDISSQPDDRKTWLSDFTLSAGGKFYTQPDHHGGTEFKIISVDPDKVTIEYKSTFDHRSFGPDMITEDSGIIELFYR